MDDKSTLRIVVDSTPAEAGAERVSRAISSMSSNSSESIDKLSVNYNKLQGTLYKSSDALVTLAQNSQQLNVLSTNSDKLSSSLNSATNSVTSFSSATSKLESISQSTSGLNSNFDKLQSSLSKAKDELQKFSNVSTQNQSINSSINGISTSFDKLQGSLSKAKESLTTFTSSGLQTQSVNQAASILANNFDKIQSSILKNKDAITVLSSSGNQLNSINPILTGLNSNFDKLQNSLSRTKDSITTFSTAASSLNNISQPLTSISSTFDKLQGSLSRSKDELVTFNTAISQLGVASQGLNSLSGNFDKLQNSLSKSKDSLSSFANSATSSTNSAVSNTDKISTFVNKSTSGLSTVSSSAGQSLGVLSSSYDKMNSFFNKASSGLTSFSKSVTDLYKGLEGSFDRLSTFLGKTNALLLGFFAALGAGYVLKSFLDRMIEVNEVFTSFVATMNVVTGSIDKTNKEYEYLLAFSNRVGVSIESVTKQYGRLAASMKDVDESGEMTRHVFEAISEASTVLHLKGHETNMLFLALEQAASKGKVSLEEFQRQLSNKLPDAMGLASRSMNMSQAEFRDSVTKGTLNVYEVLIKLSNQIKKEYGGSIDYASNQFTSKLNVMKNSIFELYRVIGQSGAMDGLVRVLSVVTDKLGDASIGKVIGDSLGELFKQLADWMATITKSDIRDFFLGFGGIIKSFTVLMQELVRTFSMTVNGKADFISFSETVAKMMIIMTDAAMTLVAAILQIPLSVSAVLADISVLMTTLNGIKNWSIGKDNWSGVSGDIDKAVTERNKTLKMADTNLSILLGSEDSPTMKAWKRTDDVFNDMKKKRAEMENEQTKITKKPVFSWMAKSDDDLNSMLGKLPPPAPPKEKEIKPNPDTAFEQESVRLTKLAGVANLEYNNILNDKIKTEGRNRVEVQAKLKFDKDYIAMSGQMVQSLLSMADAADIAQSKKIAADQYQNDMLSLNKQIYLSELDLQDILKNRNPIQDKNIRQLEEKIKFDNKYLSMSKTMIDNERARADSADKLAVSVESARKAQAANNATLQEGLQIQVKLNQLQKYNYVSKYNNESNAKNSFSEGGDNQFVKEADQIKILSAAKERDRANRELDRQQMKSDSNQAIEQLQFEIDMQGKSTEEIRRATENRRIDLEIKKLSVDATDDELLKYQELNKFLKSQLSKTLDEFYGKQASVSEGVMNGLTAYLDKLKNVNENVSNLVQSAFSKMEDMFVSFAETGKLSFKDFARSIIKDLLRIMIQLFIMKPIVEFVMGLLGGGGGGFSFGGGSIMSAGSSAGSLMAAKGHAFDGGKTMFAKGGQFTNQVIDSPTSFPIGVMGEAGPEAIMPLGRDSQGRLGIRSSDSGKSDNNINTYITVHIEKGETKDDSKESGNSIANKIKSVVVGVLNDEMRPGGILAR